MEGQPEHKEIARQAKISEIELDEFDAVARRLDEAKKMLEESASVKRTVEKSLWQ